MSAIEGESSPLGAASWVIETVATTVARRETVEIHVLQTVAEPSWVEQGQPIETLFDIRLELGPLEARTVTLEGDQAGYEIEDLALAFTSHALKYLDVDIDGAETEYQIAAAVLELPIVTFGSPPESWELLRALGSQGPFVGVSAYLVYDGQPVLAGIAAGTGFIVWFVRPSAQALRDHVTRLIKRKLGQPGDS